MGLDGSITHCLHLLRQGDQEAVRLIWQRYFPRLVQQARRALTAVARRAADEEDVALSAIDRFCRAAQQGRFPDLADRDGLWRLLLRITTRRALDLARRERRQRRGGGATQAALTGAEDEFDRLSSLAADEPSPAFAAEMAEACRGLLDCLPDADLRTLAVAKLEGYGNQEIADSLGCSIRTVERRLQLIRDLWRAEESR
jgi:DNA-directed RNA polymerase specialized sigma24 family protein